MEDVLSNLGLVLIDGKPTSLSAFKDSLLYLIRTDEDVQRAIEKLQLY